MGTLARGPDVPFFTPKTAELWWRAQFGTPPHALAEHFDWQPMAKLAKLLRRRLGALPPTMPQQPSGPPPPALGVEALVDAVLNNYQANLRVARTLCREFGVRCVFLWQPVPYYEYDRNLHRYFPPYGETEEAFQICWERVQKIEEPPVFLGHLLREYGPGRRVFVDDFHYNPGFSRVLAQRAAAATGPSGGRGRPGINGARAIPAKVASSDTETRRPFEG